jgi:hypothetical protein
MVDSQLGMRNLGSLDVARELSMDSGCQLAAAQLYELNLHSSQYQLVPTSGAAV